MCEIAIQMTLRNHPTIAPSIFSVHPKSVRPVIAKKLPPCESHLAPAVIHHHQHHGQIGWVILSHNQPRIVTHTRPHIYAMNVCLCFAGAVGKNILPTQHSSGGILTTNTNEMSLS